MDNKLSELKAIAEKAKELGGINNYKKGKDAVAAFQATANPATVLALLAELEASSLQCRGIEQERELFRLERVAHQLHAQALEQRIAELDTVRESALHAAVALTRVGLDVNDYESCMHRLHECGAIPSYCIAVYVDYVHGRVSDSKLLDFGLPRPNYWASGLQVRGG